MRKRDAQADTSWRPCPRVPVAALSLVVLLAGLGASPAPAAAVRLTVAKAASAHKEPVIRLKLIGNSYTAVYTDGVRWAVYEPSAGVTRILNTIKGTTTIRPAPEGCTGGLIAIGGGEILYACANPECPNHAHSCPIEPREEYENTRFVVEDITTGAQHPLAGENHLPTSNVGVEGGPGILEAIGHEWAQGATSGHNGTSIWFVNWHTGAVEREASSSGDAAFFADLDSAELLQPLCAPLTRPANSVSAAPAVAPAQYEPPFAVIGPLGYEQVFLQLRRCGSRMHMLLPEGGPYASSVQLGGGILSWLGSGKRGHYTRYGGAYLTKLYAHDRAWHGPFYRVAGLPAMKVLKTETPPMLQHTSNMVFATVRLNESEITQIYSARLP